ncbi:MAG: hypothetical protein ACM3S0_17970 [Acidobacteriota bacterium]
MPTPIFKSKWLAIAVLGIIVLLGALVRFQDLTEKTIAHIEIYVPGIQLPSGLSDPNPRLGLRDTLIGVMVDGEPHPPAYYIFMLGWTRLFGAGILSLRLPSVLLGIASILLIAWLGLLERDKWTGILAAGMFAFNGHQVFWSQTAKMYSMGCFLGILSTLLLLLAFRRQSWQRAVQVAYLVVTLAGLTTVVYFWLLFFTHILWVLARTIAKRNAAPGLLRWQFLAWILASPLLSLAIFQSHRESYLSPNPLQDLVDYLQFGFLFEPDFFALAPQTWLAVATLVLLPVGLALLVLGLWAWGRNVETEEAVAVAVPWPLTVFAGLLAFVAILRLAQFTRGLDASRTGWVVASSLVPLLLVVIDLLLRRYWNHIQNMGGGAIVRGALDRVRNSPSILLAILPVAALGAVAPMMPLLASRTAMLFTPYLLLVVAWGVLSLLRRHRVWAALLPALAVIFWFSIVYYRDSAIEHPTDYKGLAEQWIPQIGDSDLVFLQRHWATTPIFYYLKGDRYHFIASNYGEAVQEGPTARIWVLTPTGLPDPPEMVQALKGYDAQKTLEALRIKATLYTAPGHGSTATGHAFGGADGSFHVDSAFSALLYAR